MADVLKLKDGDVRPVAGVEDVIEIIKEKLGDDIANYLSEELELQAEEYNALDEAYDALVEEYDALTEEYDALTEKNNVLEKGYDELEKEYDALISKLEDSCSENNIPLPKWYWDSDSF